MQVTILEKAVPFKGKHMNSTKQKVNLKSLTESKMVAAENSILKILWTKHLIEAQVTKSILLEIHGKATLGKGQATL